MISAKIPDGVAPRRLILRATLAAAACLSPCLAIAQNGSGALTLTAVLQQTLAANRDVQLQNSQADAAAGAALQARGVFDPVVSLAAVRDRERRPLTLAERFESPLTEQRTNSASVSAGVAQRTDSGATLSAGVVSTYAEDRVSSQLGFPSQTTRSLVFGVKLPLARGAGANSYANASLRAAERDQAAAVALARFAVSQSLRDSAIAYWDFLSRWRQLDIARAGEQRTQSLLQELRKLIAADEIPAADLDLAVANHTERVNARIAAEQALLDARQVLARVMGTAPGALDDRSQPVDDFPALSETAAAPGTPPALDAVIAHRGDWLAQELGIAALRERVAGAQDLKRPQVDLSVNVGSSGLREAAPVVTTADPFTSRLSGPSVFAMLSVELPVGNRAASGQIRQASAQLDQAEIQRESLRSDIASRLESARADLRRSAQALSGSRQIVERYARALENEKTRRRIGSATLIDVVNVEDRYFHALLDDVQRRRNYAVSLVRLAHETDTLLHAAGSSYEIHPADFLQAHLDTDAR